MSVMQQSGIPMPGVPRRRQPVIARRYVSIRGLVRGFLAAVAWTLAGAGIALAVVVVAALAMLRLTDIDGSSPTSLDSPDGLVASAALLPDASDFAAFERLSVLAHGHAVTVTVGS
jgi:hypothetical protein